MDQQKDMDDLMSEIDVEEDQVPEKEEDVDDDDEEEEDDNDDDEEEEDDEDVYKDSLLHPEVTSWADPVTGETVHGIKVMNVLLSTDCELYEADLCTICLEPYIDKMHQMCCPPCGHIIGMSCLEKWMGPSHKCPQCDQSFSLHSVRLLYETRPSIPASALQKASIKCFSFNKIGFTTFREFIWTLRTNAINNRSNILKQLANVLVRQDDAIKRRAALLTMLTGKEEQVDVLERQNDAMKRKSLNRMTDEEEWAKASEQQAAVVFRRKADALRKWAYEYQCKADALGHHAKSLRQQAKSLGRLAKSYLASKKFYKQRCEEFLGLHDNKITE